MAEENNLKVTEDGKIIKTELPFTGVRKAIGNNMETSFKTGAPSSSFIHTDVSAGVALKARHRADGEKFTYTDYYIKLAAAALAENPMLNASLAGKRVQQYETVNVSLGVAVNGLLYAPVIRNVEKKGLREITADRDALIKKAAEGKLTLEDIAGGTFTISNLGMYDVCGFTPIVSAPQAAVLGIGRMKKEPVVVDDEIVIRPMSYFSITVDHAIVSGTETAEFYRSLIKCIQNPEEHIPLD